MASRKEALARRANRVRRHLKSVANGRPRLSVHRSSKNIYVQVIDDVAGKTLAAASTLRIGLPLLPAIPGSEFDPPRASARGDLCVEFDDDRGTAGRGIITARSENPRETGGLFLAII